MHTVPSSCISYGDGIEMGLSAAGLFSDGLVKIAA
jgi:hypothetical protein